jgi:hypothetical protein
MNAHGFRVRASFVALVGFGLSGAARAQQLSADASASAQKEAQAALAEAHKLGKRGDFEGACVLFEKSAALATNADALLNAGICREYHADLAGALTAFERALEASQGRTRQQAAIQPRLDALRPRVPTVSITPSPTPDSVVEIDAQILQRLDAALRLNPGEHQLRATAPGARPHTQTFTLAAGQALTLAIPELPPDPPAQAQPPVLPTSKPARASNAADSPELDTTAAWRKPLVFGGLGLFVAGGAFSAWQLVSMSNARSRKHDLADEHSCNIEGDRAPGPSCDARVRARIDDIYHDEEEPARKRAWVGLAVSGVGAATALIGFFALPSSEARPGAHTKPRSFALQIQPELGPGVCAAQLSTRW